MLWKEKYNHANIVWTKVVTEVPLFSFVLVLVLVLLVLVLVLVIVLVALTRGEGLGLLDSSFVVFWLILGDGWTSLGVLDVLPLVLSVAPMLMEETWEDLVDPSCELKSFFIFISIFNSSFDCVINFCLLSSVFDFMFSFMNSMKLFNPNLKLFSSSRSFFLDSSSCFLHSSPILEKLVKLGFVKFDFFF